MHHSHKTIQNYLSPDFSVTNGHYNVRISGKLIPYEKEDGKEVKTIFDVWVLYYIDNLPIMSSPKVLILRAFSLNITSQNRAKGVCMTVIVSCTEQL